MRWGEKGASRVYSHQSESSSFSERRRVSHANKCVCVCVCKYVLWNKQEGHRFSALSMLSCGSPVTHS